MSAAGVSALYKVRLTRFMRGEWALLHRETAPTPGPLAPLGEEEARGLRMRRHVEAAQPGRAHAAQRQDEPLMVMDETCVDKLLNLFPGALKLNAPPPVLPEPPGPLPPRPTPAQREPGEFDPLDQALAKAPCGVARGRSGWTMEMLVWAAANGAQEAIQIWTDEFNANRVPPCIAQYAAGGHVSAFRKENSEKPRPIVPAEPIAKLAGGVNRASTRCARNAALFPLAFGAGAPGGTDTIACAIKLALEVNPDWAVVKRDAANGYGAMRRECVRSSLIEKGFGDTALPLFDSKYGQPVVLTCLLADGRTILLLHGSLPDFRARRSLNPGWRAGLLHRRRHHVRPRGPGGAR